MRLSLKVGCNDVPLKLGGAQVQSVVSGDYGDLSNKPSVEGNELVGDKTFDELGLNELSNVEIAQIFKTVMKGQ